MNSVNPETKVGTFRVIVRPLVAWIWLGGLLMIFGTAVSMAPSVREVLGEARAPARAAVRARRCGSAAVLFVLACAVAYALFGPALAQRAERRLELAARGLGHDAATPRSASCSRACSASAATASGCRCRPAPASWAEDARAQHPRSRSPTGKIADRDPGGLPQEARPAVDRDPRGRRARSGALGGAGGADRARGGAARALGPALEAQRPTPQTAAPMASAAVPPAPADERYDAALEREIERDDA